MLYTRSSFIEWLEQVEECEIIPIKNDHSTRGTLLIKNGSAKFYMHTDAKDMIDYEEIYIAYKYLYLSQLPGEKDLKRIE